MTLQFPMIIHLRNCRFLMMSILYYDVFCFALKFVNKQNNFFVEMDCSSESMCVRLARYDPRVQLTFYMYLLTYKK